MSQIQKGVWVLYGDNHPDVSFPGFTIERGGHAIAVDAAGNRFCISRDEETKDWLLCREVNTMLWGKGYEFSNPSHRFPRT